MYKYIMATFFLVLFVLFLEPAQKLLSNFLHLEQPTIHQIEEGEWLSKVAQNYYGDPSFAKELALINRAPDNNLIFPGEKIIVPDFENIRKIRHARQLSIVNQLVSEQQALLNSSAYSMREVKTDDKTEIAVPVAEVSESTMQDDLEIMDQVAAMENMIEKTTLDASPFSNKTIWGSALFGGLFFIAGIIYAVRKKQGGEEVTIYGATPDEDSTDSERSIYLDDFGEKEVDRKKEEEGREIELLSKIS